MPHILPPSGRATKQQSAELDVASESDNAPPRLFLISCPAHFARLFTKQLLLIDIDWFQLAAGVDASLVCINV